MKKVLSVTALLLTTVLMLASCSLFFDVDRCVEQLKAEGLTVGNSYTTEEEAKFATALVNSEIRLMGGEFESEVKSYTALIQGGDYSKSVQFITFAKPSQAKAYAELYVADRADGSDWRVAQGGSTVVLTNLEIAQEIVPLKFK